MRGTTDNDRCAQAPNGVRHAASAPPDRAEPPVRGLPCKSTTQGSRTILTIGPSPDEVGGMATVVEQMMSLDFNGRFRVALLPCTLRRDEGETLARRIGRHVRQGRRLVEVIRSTGAQILHIHTCSGFSFYRAAADMLVGQRLGCRVILHIHGAAFDRFYDRLSRLQKHVVGRTLARADGVIALSSGWRSQLLRMSPTARVSVVENAVAQLPPRMSQPGTGPCRFVLLARMDVWKGIDDLLDACALLRRGAVPVRLTLAGPPGTAGDAKTIVHKIVHRGVQEFVKYVGAVHGQDKDALLSSADAYVQSSHHEGLPISLLEALAMGLPAVVTRVGAVPEVISEGVCGLLVPPHRPDLLAHAMRKLAVEPALRTRMADEAVKLVRRRFSLARLRNDLENLYDTLLATRRTAAPATESDGVAHPPAIRASRKSGSARTVTAVSTY